MKGWPPCHKAALRGLAVLAMLSTTPICGAGTLDGLTISGQVRQSASVSAALPGLTAISGGAASTLALSLEAERESASVRASAHISILGGDEATLFWASALASPGKAVWLLAAPSFDPAAAVPTKMAILSLDELSLRWDTGQFAFEAGKTFANWGVGKAFSPADFFSEFDYSSGSPARLSKLLARATWFPGATSRVDIVCDPVAAEGATLAARAYATAFDSLAFALAAGLRDAAGPSPRRVLGAIEASSDLPFVSPYGETSVTVPLDNPAAMSWSFLAGGTTQLGGATILGEYLFSPEASVRHSLYAQAVLPLDDWIALSVPALCYPESGVLATGLTLAASGMAGLDWALYASANHSASGAWSGSLAFTALFAF